MPKYRITMERVDTFLMDVEADDEYTAVEKAYEVAPSGICAHDAGWGQKWSVDTGEWEEGTCKPIES